MLNAKLLKLHPVIEEEVVLEINGVTLIGFSTACPYKISLGKVYPVQLYLTCLDGLEVKELGDKKHGAERIGDSYGYILEGEVTDGQLNIGCDINIKDAYFSAHSYLNGNFVSIRIDRLGVEFLKK